MKKSLDSSTGRNQRQASGVGHTQPVFAQSVRRAHVLLAIVAIVLCAPGCSDDGGRAHLNVLFVAVDDLRPSLGVYGNEEVVTPNIDALARRGVVFTHAYCQMPVCAPSRSSILTGLRPESNGVMNNRDHFRATVPDIVTLPQHFKNNGYHTQAFGKVYHAHFDKAYQGRKLDDPPSWSVPSFFASPQYYYSEEGRRIARMIFGRRPGCQRDRGRICIHNRGQAITDDSTQDALDSRLDEWSDHFVQGLITEAPEVADERLRDGVITGKAIEALRTLQDRPFFLAVGYTKPHIPYVAPRTYWDLYDPSTLTLPSRMTPPANASPYTIPTRHEHAVYTGVAGEGVLDEQASRHLTHGYYACVSFIDAQIGKLLGELERLGLDENTIVVFWGDHGYHLGENGRWGKQTCLETATRSPLIISSPLMKARGQTAEGLVELVDIYPSLCDLADLPKPSYLEGDSFASLLDDPSQQWKTGAFSQCLRRVPRAGVSPKAGDVMGYSMRTQHYRITEWRSAMQPEKVVGRELYDYREDPEESRNLAADEKYPSILLALQRQMSRGWEGARPPVK